MQHSQHVLPRVLEQASSLMSPAVTRNAGRKQKALRHIAGTSKHMPGSFGRIHDTSDLWILFILSVLSA